VLVFFHRLCPAVIALDIQASFGIGGTLLGFFSSAYFYSYAAMQLPTGLMADFWGPRKTVASFLILAGIGSIMMGFAPNLPLAMAGRILVGIGVSTVFVCNFKILSEWFSARKFVIMGTLFMAMGGVGAAISGAPLAWMSNLMGWRMTLVLVGIVTLLLAVLAAIFVRNRPSEMGLPPVGKEQEGSRETRGLMQGLSLVVLSPRFWPIALWAFCVVGLSFAVGGLWGGPYLMRVYGMSKSAAGEVLSTFALALIAGSPLLGWAANRFGRKPVLMGCSALMLAVSLLFFWFVESLTVPALYLLFFCFFLSGGAVGPILATVSKESFPISIAGTSVGLVNIFPFIGAAVFQIIMGAMVSSEGGGQAAYTVEGFRRLFLICVVGTAVSLAASSFVRETWGTTENRD
jgi:sugar phosphate permease